MKIICLFLILHLVYGDWTFLNGTGSYSEDYPPIVNHHTACVRNNFIYVFGGHGFIGGGDSGIL